MPRLRLMTTLATTLLLALSACGGDGGDGGNGPGAGVPVTSGLTCEQPGGTFQECQLVLSGASGFRVVLVSTSCVASGNSIRLTQPVTGVLTSNACYEPSGREFRFDGPFAAGTAIDLQIQSVQLANPAALRVSGAYPSWTLNFEDGADSDFNDVVMQVEAL
jgi:hypothetical protein